MASLTFGYTMTTMTQLVPSIAARSPSLVSPLSTSVDHTNPSRGQQGRLTLVTDAMNLPRRCIMAHILMPIAPYTLVPELMDTAMSTGDTCIIAGHDGTNFFLSIR